MRRAPVGPMPRIEIEDIYEPDYVPPEESPDGVDLSLIRWTLSLTPRERLELLQDWVVGLAELRHGRVAER